MSEPPPKRTYTQEEVTEILKRAMKQQNMQKEGLSHDELVEMAGEVGIDRAALESATAELVETKADQLAREDDARALAEERSRLFAGFVSSLFFYLVICGALYFIDTRFTGGTWYFWPALGWGIALLFQLNNVLFPQRKLERRRARELKRAEKEARRALRHERARRLRSSFGLDGHDELNRLKAEKNLEEFEASVHGQPSRFPLAINTLGSARRMAMSLGLEKIEEKMDWPARFARLGEPAADILSPCADVSMCNWPWGSLPLNGFPFL